MANYTTRSDSRSTKLLTLRVTPAEYKAIQALTAVEDEITITHCIRNSVLSRVTEILPTATLKRLGL